MHDDTFDEVKAKILHLMLHQIPESIGLDEEDLRINGLVHNILRAKRAKSKFPKNGNKAISNVNSLKHYIQGRQIRLSSRRRGDFFASVGFIPGAIASTGDDHDLSEYSGLGFVGFLGVSSPDLPSLHVCYSLPGFTFGHPVRSLLEVTVIGISKLSGYENRFNFEPGRYEVAEHF
ncbi:hypothetical protein CAPTEDRAFT_195699 [Capitella teleta]|uniref:Uncharacterized protein n=1 Tax=Capitella teleta TaxID=283909 RepID=X1ZVE4_CAPTE|nr:hypothetical protein CAPTEDRAFT_195699 [Capitella teleta]|eukprot:ELT88411.1 hypothetical protein CAPTEDRAFT_195699 [Capitella teleta]